MKRIIRTGVVQGINKDTMVNKIASNTNALLKLLIQNFFKICFTISLVILIIIERLIYIIFGSETPTPESIGERPRGMKPRT